MVSLNEFNPNRFTSQQGFTLPYQLRVPQGEGPFPVLLLMHGAGERGTDNQAPFVHFNPLFAEESTPLNQAIIIIPQCPEDMRWVEYGWEKGSYLKENAPLSPAFFAVTQLLQQILSTLPVDPKRVYVAGLSMGGFATWRLLAEYPNLFAAGIPICGGGPLDEAQALAELPIHTFHCVNDDVVPVTASRAMVSAIQAITPNRLKYTEFPDGGHGAWFPVFATTQYMSWLFEQSK